MKVCQACSGLLCAVLLILQAATAQASEQARQWIAAMSERAESLDYTGYLVYQRGRQSSGFYLSHWHDEDGVELKKLVYQDGQPLELLEKAGKRYCLPACPTNSRAVQLPLTQGLAGESTALWQFYQASLVGESRVAGREVVHARVEAQDTDRYSYDFYLDRQTGLMLKMRLLDHDKLPLESFQYIHIDYRKAPAAGRAFDPGAADSVEVPLASDAGQAHSPALSPAWLPRGFVLQQAQRLERGNSHYRYLYSDGLAQFSLFVEKSAASPAQRPVSDRIGATSVVSVAKAVAGAHYTVTVAGEIPLPTAEKIALSAGGGQ